ncbi:MAG: phage integrase SAM-like domain-containing protein [Bacteroidota bacterium]
MSYKLTLKRPKAKESSLMTEFMKNGVPFKLYTGKTVQIKNWSPSKQVVLSGEENYLLINKYLDNWKSEISRIIQQFEADKIRITKDAIQTELDKAFKKDVVPAAKEGVVNDFISFMEAYNERKKDKKRNLQKLNQAKKFVIVGFNLVTKKHLSEWEALSIKEKSRTNLKADHKLKFEDINLKFIEKFREYLYTAKFTVIVKGEKVTRNYKINYIDKQIKTLKQFVTTAIEEGYVKRFTWSSIKSEKKDVDTIYTDFSEIQMLYDEPFTKKTEVLVRDKYVLNCFLGMRYSDLNKLEPHFFSKKSIAGKEFVVYTGRTKKTDHKIEFAIHPIAQQILKKYQYNIPKLSAKEFNEVLKVVAHGAGLRGLERIREIRGSETIVRDIPKYELMSSHAGRRSFCTNFYNEGVSIAAIMSISGHQTENEFRKYIKKASVRLDIVAEQVFAIQGLKTALKVA